MRTAAQRYPLVDALRAIAAIVVLGTHAAFFAGAEGPGSLTGHFTMRLEVGVAIFFCISGFLLYRPFAAARHAGVGAPATGAYAWRRFLRIVPAYWLALALSAWWLGRHDVFTADSLWTYFGFAQTWREPTIGGCSVVPSGACPVADPRLAGQVPLECVPGDPLTHLDCLEHGTARGTATAHVVDGTGAWIAVKGEARLHEVGSMEVVPDLLPAVAEDRVRDSRRGRLQQIGEETVELRAGVSGSSDAAAAQADGRHPEVAAILLNEQVGRCLGDPEEGMRGSVDGHGGIDPVEVRVIMRQFQTAGTVLEGQLVRQVAIDLVGRDEDECRAGSVGPD
jgi:hypothetical protein